MGLSSIEKSLPTSQESDSSASWADYPRPQTIRRNNNHNPRWRSLNGTWELALHYRNDELPSFPHTNFEQRIQVPYPIESRLSGVEIIDDIPHATYHKAVEIPDAWRQDGNRTFLHIDSADYATDIYMGDTTTPVTSHIGGYTAFRAELTKQIQEGQSDLYLRITDDLQNNLQPRGKQSRTLVQHGCFYTPKTGISGPVWMEALPMTFLDQRKYYPSLKEKALAMRLDLNGETDGLKLNTKVLAEGKEVGNLDILASASNEVMLSLHEVIPYEPKDGARPFRYDIHHTLYDTNGKEVDHVEGKFGLRDFSIKDKIFLLNKGPFNMRFVLYQGYHPDSLYLPPDLSVTEKHMQLIKEMGFNGIRYHQNVPHPCEVEIFDREGIFWSLEHPNWSANHGAPQYTEVVWQEYLEAMETHFNSPSWIIATPLNETPHDQHPLLIPTIYQRTKAYVGSTRLVSDVSGFNRADINNTDFLTIHDYTTSPEELRENILKQHERTEGTNIPVVFNEYGGIRTDPKDGNWERWYSDTLSDKTTHSDRNAHMEDVMKGDVWGYGEAPKTQNEAINRLRGLTEVVKDDDKVAGSCYTQFNDTGMERNGLTDPYGNPKLPVATIRSIIGS